MEQENEQEKCTFLENLETMRSHGICLKISTADVQFDGTEPVLAFHLVCIGQRGAGDEVLLHGVCRKASGIQKTLMGMACISAALCRICADRQIIGSVGFDEDEMEEVVKEIMREHDMDIEQLCRPHTAPDRESWMFN